MSVKNFINTFNPKRQLIDLANSRGGFDPIDYINATEGSFEMLSVSNTSGGIAQYYTVYSEEINTTIANAVTVQAGIVKWLGTGFDLNKYFVAFKAGALTKSTIWTLPLYDGVAGQVLTTTGTGVLKWDTAAGSGDVLGPTESTINAIATWADEVGGALLNSKATIDPETGDITTTGKITGSDLNIISENNNVLLTLNASDNQEESLVLNFPENVGTFGQVLTTDGGKFGVLNQAILSWSDPAGDGDVKGPEESTPNAIALWNSEDGKILQNSKVTIDPETGDIAMFSNIVEPETEGEPPTIITLTLAANKEQEEDLTLTFPVNAGEEGQVIVTDGEGGLSWAEGVTADGEERLENQVAVWAAPEEEGKQSNVIVGTPVTIDPETGDIVTDGIIQGSTLVLLPAENENTLTLAVNKEQEGNFTLTFPIVQGTKGQVLAIEDDNSQLIWVDSAGGGDVIATGERKVTQVAVWAAPDEPTNEEETNNLTGSKVTIDSDGNISGNTLVIKAGSETLTFKGGAQTTKMSLTFPADQGEAGNVLATDGVGNLSWGGGGGGAPFGATYIIGEKNEELPNAKSLGELKSGIVFNTTTTEEGKAAKGELSTQSTISLDNLPGLSSTKIWRGGSDGRPVESDDLTTTEETANEAKKTADSAQSTATKASSRATTAIATAGTAATVAAGAATAAGIAVSTANAAENTANKALAESGNVRTEQEEITIDSLAYWSARNQISGTKSIQVSTGIVNELDAIKGIGALSCGAVNVLTNNNQPGSITADGVIISGANISCRSLSVIDNNKVHRLDTSLGFNSPEIIFEKGHHFWTLPNGMGDDGQVLARTGGVADKVAKLDWVNGITLDEGVVPSQDYVIAWGQGTKVQSTTVAIQNASGTNGTGLKLGSNYVEGGGPNTFLSLIADHAMGLSYSITFPNEVATAQIGGVLAIKSKDEGKVVFQWGIAGNVSGPVAAAEPDKTVTPTAIAIWDGGTGRKIANSDAGITNVSANSGASLNLKSHDANTGSILIECPHNIADTLVFTFPNAAATKGQVLACVAVDDTNTDRMTLGWADGITKKLNDETINTHIAIWDGNKTNSIANSSASIVNSSAKDDLDLRGSALTLASDGKHVLGSIQLICPTELDSILKFIFPNTVATEGQALVCKEVESNAMQLTWANAVIGPEGKDATVEHHIAVWSDTAGTKLNNSDVAIIDSTVDNGAAIALQTSKEGTGGTYLRSAAALGATILDIAFPNTAATEGQVLVCKEVVEKREMTLEWADGGGNVSGPVAADPVKEPPEPLSTDKAIAIWDGDTGRKIANSDVLVKSAQGVIVGSTISLQGAPEVLGATAGRLELCAPPDMPTNNISLVLPNSVPQKGQILFAETIPEDNRSFLGWSAITIGQVQLKNTLNVNNDPPSEPVQGMSGLGFIQFNSDKQLGVGQIYVDTLSPISFIESKANDTNVCTIITGGDIGASVTSHSALLEIKSTTGCMLFSRLTKSQRDDLMTPLPGMVLYNIDDKKLNLCVPGAAGNSNTWEIVGGDGGGNVSGPVAAAEPDKTVTPTAIAIWDGGTGRKIANSKVVIDGSGNLTADGTLTGTQLLVKKDTSSSGFNSGGGSTIWTLPSSAGSSGQALVRTGEDSALTWVQNITTTGAKADEVVAFSDTSGNLKSTGVTVDEIKGYKKDAEEAKKQAVTARDEAVAARDEAVPAAAAAKAAAKTAAAAAEEASTAAATATFFSGTAFLSNLGAALNAGKAEKARDKADKYANNAKTSEKNASTSEKNASKSATTASNAATTATNKATDAATFAGTASGAADRAEAEAGNASTSEKNAANSEKNSETFYNNLQTTNLIFSGQVTGSGLIKNNITLSLASDKPAQDGFVLSSTTAGILSWIANKGGGGTVTSVGLITDKDKGLIIDNTPVSGVGGNITINLNTQLQGLSGINSNGFITRTADGTYASRAIADDGKNISITNGNGVTGNPTISLNTSLTGLTSISTGSLTATGTVSGNAITAASTISGNTIKAGGDITATGQVTGEALRIPFVNSKYKLTFAASTTPTASKDITLIFPTSYGENGQVLSTDANGTLSWVANGGGGGVTSVAVSTTSTGLTIGGSPITTSGTITVDLNQNLKTLAGFAGAGFVTYTHKGFKARTIAEGANISVDNSNGDDGNPTIGLNTSLIGLTSISTGSLTASGAVSAGTITSEGNITGSSLQIPINKHNLIFAANGAPTTDITLSFPTTLGSNGQVLSTDGAGTLSWIANGSGTVTKIETGTGLTGGPITNVGIISLDDTVVTPGAYTNANITVDQQGRITAASDGTSGDGNVNVNSPSVKDHVPCWSNTTGMLTTTSLIYQKGSQVFIGDGQDDTNTTLQVYGPIKTSSAIYATTTIRIRTNDSYSMGLFTGVNANYNLTFPAASPDNNQILQSDSSGNFTWINTPGGGGGSGTVTSVGLSTSTNGLSINNSPITTAGVISVDLNAELQGLSGINTNGLITRTGFGAYLERTITAGSNINVTNGDGVSGNPTIALSTTPSITSLTATGIIKASAISSSTIITTGDITAGGQVTGKALQIPINGHKLIFTANGTPTADISLSFPTVSGASGNVLSTNGSGILSWVANSAGGATQVDFYTTPDTTTWTKNPNAKFIQIILIGGGGGGASGGTYADDKGGSGGSGGAYCESPIMPAAQFENTIAVTVGAGGIGGQADENSDGGVIGGDGGNSIFDKWFVALGGKGGGFDGGDNSVAGYPDLPSNKGTSGGLGARQSFHQGVSGRRGEDGFGFAGCGGGGGCANAAGGGQNPGGSNNNPHVSVSTSTLYSGPMYITTPGAAGINGHTDREGGDGEGWSSGTKIIGGPGGGGGASGPAAGGNGGRFGGGGGGGSAQNPSNRENVSGGDGGAGVVVVYQW